MISTPILDTLEEASDPVNTSNTSDMKGIVITSGGLDSTTLVYHLRTAYGLDASDSLHLLAFDYGQRHRKELQFAQLTARNLGLRFDIVDLTALTHLISNSALTSPHLSEYPTAVDILYAKPEIEVPEGHYAESNMKLTVVPNRNMIMLSIAAGVAVNEGANFIATGVHAGDHDVYPDCRPEFIEAVADTIWAATDGFHQFEPAMAHSDFDVVTAPFVNWSKADIAYRAIELGVPLHLTWSCYKGGEHHCGRCGTCVERLEAISIAENRARMNGLIQSGYVDDTIYEDTEYWKTQVKKQRR